MYHKHFGLKEPAFSIAVNPKYLYMSVQHKEALAHLVYGVQGGGFILLSGEVGTGKTTVIRCLLEQLPDNTEIAFVLNPMANVQEMLRTICEELGMLGTHRKATIKDLMDALQKQLLENHAKSKRTVLLIDEAQLLSAEVLEQIRLLTNLETSTEKLLQIILVGQPEINELLAQPRLRQLSQRITARFHIRPLNIFETQSYISHRLVIAGKKDAKPIFTPEIIKKIHQFAGGIPRLINIICERLMIGAYSQNKYDVDEHIFKLALREVEAVKHQQDTAHKAIWSHPVFIGLGTVLVCLAIIWLVLPSSKKTVEPSLSSPPTLAQNKAPSQQLENSVQGEVTRVTETEKEHTTEFFDDLLVAQAMLFNYYDIELSFASHPCWQTDQHGFSCAETRLETWQDIKHLNRPVILRLVTTTKKVNYAILVGIDTSNALLISTEGIFFKVALDTLGPLWAGEANYLWQAPANFDKPITAGMNSSVVEWVAKRLAKIDQQETAITGKRFTDTLKQRIKIFQKNHNLKDDGVIGERTLMKIAEISGDVNTLIVDLDKAMED